VNVNDVYPANSTFNQLTQPANGTVVFSPNGSFTYTPDPGFTGTDSYTYEVCLPAPNGAVCDPATVTIVVGPDAVDDSYVTPFETPVMGDVSDNDDYPVGSVFAVATPLPMGVGTLTFNNDGTFEYEPAMDFTGVTSFTYTVCLPAPNGAVCDEATVTLVVGPEANDDSYTTPYETPVTANVNVNDVYPANSTFNQLTQPANGTVVFSPNGSFTYTPDPGFTGTDSYTYEVCLPAPNGAVCDPATVTIVVGPDAVDDSYVTPFETPVMGDVSDNDDYPVGSVFAVATPLPMGVGTLTFNNDGTFEYEPAMDFTGVTSFTYTVCLPAPNGAVCDEATVTLVVGPEANDDSYTTPYETPVTANVNVNDVYPANSTFNQLTQPANGTVVFSPNGSFTYTPDPGFTGTDSYTYEVCLPAPNGAVCDPATVTIVVGPDAVDDSYVTPFETPVMGDVSDNDDYPVGSVFAVATPLPMGVGTLTFNNDGTFEYEPAMDFTGVTSFTYTVCLPAPNGAVCDEATVTLVVGPEANDDSYTTPYETPVTANVNVNDVYPANSTFNQLTQPANGTVVFSPNGSFTYTPDPGFTGTDSYTYEVCLPAPNGAVCDPATVTIVVGPDAVDDSYVTPFETPVMGDVSDNDDYPVGSVFAVATPLPMGVGTLTFNNDGTFEYEPAMDFTGVTSFTYTVCLPAPNGAVCDEATVTLVVGPEANDDSYTTPYETPVTANVNVNDVYPANSTFNQLTQPANGTVVFSPNGSFTYTPDPGFTGTDSYTYEVCLPAPNGAVCDPATVTIVVGPDAVDDSYVTPFETPVMGDVSDNDDYPVGSVFAVATPLPMGVGTLTFNNDGTFEYEPAMDFTGVTSFTYTVCLPAPNGAVCDEATVTLVVGPEANDDSYTTPYETPVTANVNVNDVYPANSTFNQLTQPANGTVVFSPNGSFTYTPNPGFTGTDSYTYEVCLPAPNGAVCDPATVTIVVGPDAVDDSYVTPFETPVMGDVSDNDDYPVGSVFAVATPLPMGVGTLTFNNDGTFEYEPAMDFTGVTSFTYTVCLPAPNGAVCDEATVTLVVGPEANDDSYTTPYETPVTANVNVNDVYPANSTFNQLTQPANGTVVFSPNGSFTYTPNPGFTGTDSYTYEVCLPAPNGAVCDPATVTIVVGPDAVDDLFTTPYNTDVNGTVVTNDIYPVGSDFSLVTNVPMGTGSLAFNMDGTFTFDPADGFSGIVTFTYDVCFNPCDTATVTIVVGPDAVDDTYTTPINVPVTDNVPVNDTFPPGSQFTVVTGPSNGGVVMASDGSFIYVPNPNFSGTDVFTYSVCLPAPYGYMCDIATVTITILPACEITCPPAITDVADAGECFAEITLTLPTLGTECDPASLRYSVLNPDGSISGPFDPAVNDSYEFEVGISQITWSVEDDLGSSVTCVQQVTVTEDEDPTITCPANATINTNNLGNTGDCAGTYEWTHPLPADNCGVLQYNFQVERADGTTDGIFDLVPLLLGANQPPFDAAYDFPIGTSTVRYFVADASGNTVTCTFTVTVNDNEPPVFVNCPNTTFTISTDENCSNEVIWSIPVASDNCPGVTVAQTGGPALGSPLTPGTYNIQYTATDAAGLTATCNFTIEVVDDNAPLLVCLPDLTVSTDAGVCTWTSAAGELNPLLAVDNCPGFVLEHSINGGGFVNGFVPGGTIFPIGTSIVTYRLTDANNNTVTCSFEVTVEDGQAPVINSAFCGVTTNLNTQPGICGNTQTVNLGLVVTDNCTGTLNLQYELVILDANGLLTTYNTRVITHTFQQGVNIATLTVTDAEGNTASCSAVFVVNDNQAPVIACASGSPFARNNTTGLCGYVTQGTEFDATATDNCGVVSLTHNYGAWGNPNSLAGATFPVGTTAVVWTAEDADGNTTTCSISVVVTDAQAPVFVNCPNTTFTISTDENCSNEVIWSIPVASDNCPGVTVAQTGGPALGSPLTPGTYNIQYTATDAAGLTATCNFTIEVVDDNAPLLVCLPDLTISTDAGVCTWTSAAGELNPLLAVDNCPGFVLAHSINGGGFVNGFVPGGTIFPIGTSIVTYRLTDANNNTVTCSFEVTVEDGQAPVINSAFCGVTTNLNTQPGICGNTQTVNLGLVVTDNCTGTLNLQYELVILDANGLLTTYNTRVITHTFQQGVNIATLTVTDAEGNTASCSAVFVVNDNQAPVIACASGSPFARNNTTGLCGYVTQGTEFDATATDNCGVVSLTHNYGAWGNPNSLAGATFPVGTTVVVWTAEDADGNTTTCSISVVVTDAQAPVFVNCPNTTFTISTDENCSNEVIWSIPVASDNCPGVTVAQTGGPALGSPLTPGTYNIQYTATDAAGLTATCNFTIEVVDDNAPLLVCLPDLTVSTDAGVCTWTSAAGELNPLLAVDNCPGFVLAHSINGGGFVNGFVPGGTIFPIGTSIVTYRLTDANNNTVTCSFEVTVEDGQAPVINSAFCGVTTNLNTQPGICGNTQTVNLGLVVTDNCTGTLNLQYELVILDANGLLTTYNTRVITHTFQQGVNIATLTVTDAEGNTASCSAVFVVNDNQAPVIACASGSPFARNNTTGLCGYVTQGTEFDATATDNCGVVSLTHNYGAWGNPNSLAGATFPVGTTVVVWTAEDSDGNTTTCSISVVVTDAQAPVFVNCPNTTFTISTDENCSNEVIWSIPVASDNCPGVTVAQTGGPALGSPLTPGTYNIQYTATDAANNTATCNFTIEVVDDNAPLLVCLPDLTVSTDAGVCTWTSAAGELNPLLAVDNCPGFVLEHSINGGPFVTGPVPVTIFALGTTSVTYRLSDPSNNVVTCSFDITVVDDEAPVIAGVVCNAAINVQTDADECVSNQEFDLSPSTDNCGITSYSSVVLNANGQFNTYTTASFNHDFGVGVSIVTFTLTDAAGNTSSCSLSVVVTDAQLPTIVCPTADPIQSDCPVSVLVSGQNPANCMLVAWSTPPAPLPGTANIGATQYLLLSGTGTVGDPALYRRNGFNGNCGNSANIPFTGTLTIGGESCDFENGVTPPNYVFERENTDGICGYVAEGGEFNATGADNCGVASVSHNYGDWAIANNLDGATFPVGTTSVTWTVVDLSGNSTQCTITIVVEDTENPVFVNCPNTTFTIGVDEDCESGIIWSIPIAEDNCDIASVVETSPGGPFYGQPLDPDTYEIQYTATDIYGNTATCNFTIIVEDDSDPLLVCPPNFTVGTDAGVCTWASTASTNPLLTVDNCPDYVLTYALSGATTDNGTGLVPVGTIFAEGTTTVTYTLTDGAGNVSTCSFTVTVGDDEAPAIAAALCNETYNFNTDMGVCTSDQSMDIADFVSDNCSDDTDLTYLTVITNPDGTLQTLNGNDIDYTLELGVSYALFTITDEAGNSSTCLVSVIVSDNELPVIDCPATDAEYDNTPGECGLIAGTQFDPVLTTDNCTGFTYSHNYGGWAVPTSLAGAFFPVGEHTIVWTITDASGNTATCGFTFEVMDTEDPDANCVAQIDAVLNANGQFLVTIPMVELGSTDNCGGALQYAISRDGMTFGTNFLVNCDDALNSPITATLRVTDGNGNTDICETSVSVLDLNPPVAVCQDIVVDLDADGNASIVPSDVDGGSTDNCGVSLAINIDEFTCANTGENNVILTVTDPSNNTAVCVATVTVRDVTFPTFTCPDDVTLESCLDVVPDLASLVLDAADACGIATIVQNPVSGQPVGGQNGAGFNVTISVTDNNGNTSTCEVNLVIEDETDPYFVNCPQDVTFEISLYPNDCEGGVVWSIPVAEDDCAGVVVTQTEGPDQGENLPVGTYLIEYEAVDAGGNVATCSFTIEIIDTEEPVIVCPVNMTFTTDPGVCTWTAPTGSLTPLLATANCPFEVTYEITGATTASGSNDASGETFNLGTSTVVYTITEIASGQVWTCSFTVTVVDDQAPVIDAALCNTSYMFDTDAGECTSEQSIDLSGFVSDNCSDVDDLTYQTVLIRPNGKIEVLNGNNITYAMELGTTFAIFQITDEQGNLASCFASVIVMDNELPEIDCPVVDASYANTNGICGYVAQGAEFDATGSDNCDIASLTHNYGAWGNPNSLAGATFPVGTTEVVWTVVDGSGNSMQCTISIVVEDTENPVFVNCPNTTFTISTDANCSNEVIWSIPVADDNCGIASVVETSPGGPYYSQPLVPGTYAIQYTVTDIYDNTATCNFTIVVVDDNAPLLVCLPDMTVGTDAGVCTWTSAVGELNPLLAVDNCPGFVLEHSINGGPFVTGPVPVTVFALGTTSVTYRLTDPSNNVVTCSFDVTVVDDEAPVIAGVVCNAAINAGTDAGECVSNESFNLASSTDNCGIIQLQQRGIECQWSV
jgi:hypothetical protein